MWRVDAFRAFCERLASCFTLVRYDHRGNGLSDREVPFPDLAALSLDLVAVVDAVTDGAVHLWGNGFGGPIAIHYAATHPTRVDRLVLDGTFAVLEPDEEMAKRNRALVTMLREAPDAALAGLTYVSDPTHEERYDARVERLRHAIEPDMAQHLYRLAGWIDVTDACAQVTAPTLVMHRMHSQVFPLEASQRIANTIPGASFVGLPGSPHNPWEGDAESVLQAVGVHLGVDLSPPSRTPWQTRRAVLMFTDLVDSTATTRRLGDDAGRKLIGFHDEVVRASLVVHHGTEVAHTGDGIFASFSLASDALDAARAIRAAFAARDHEDAHLEVRIGINEGEPIADAGNLYGTAVNLAARLCAHAAAGEVLVSDVVRQIGEEKGFEFEPRPPASLKGFDEPIAVYALA
jgi:class 3 adenylate cyclase/pimeloyl-ACP methyl ester carboxylesterase